MAEGARQRRPAPLLVAVASVALLGLAFLAVAGVELVGLLVSTPDSSAVAQGSGLFFLLFGLLVLGLAVALWQYRSWALGAAVVVLLLGALMLGQALRDVGFWLGALTLGATSVAGLLALLHPVTRAALGRQ